MLVADLHTDASSDPADQQESVGTCGHFDVLRGDSVIKLSDGRYIVIGVTGSMFNLSSKRHFHIDDLLTCVPFCCENTGSTIYDTPPLVSCAIAATPLALVEEKSSCTWYGGYTSDSSGTSFLSGECR